MATDSKQRQAAKSFAAKWSGRGYEKGESQPFWIELLQKVLSMDDPFSIISFENRVKLSNTSFIDAYIKPTHVLIEQKSIEKDLRSPIPQSDGTTLTPFQQAKRYATELPYSDRPRWIVICNFREFDIYDMENPQGEPQVLYLQDLEKEYNRLSFLVDDTSVHIKKELEVSIKAGEIVGVLYEKLLAQYLHPENPESQKSLNKLCVRLVFCLYAEDAGILGSKNMFHDYMSQFSANDFRKALIEFFQVLDTKPEDRDPYMNPDLAAFPFVSGGMFAGDIEIPRITEEIRTLILSRASDDFDWSLISPTIFGAVFESTLNPATRRAGGMHYTSLENIHKVIDPLFLDELKSEMEDIKKIPVMKTRKAKAAEFQDKLASLKFLDPACGSGNFLTESYTCLRRLENEAIRILFDGERIIGELADPVKVSIYQFYGIEINDFACSVSQAALWIAETQMLQETDAIVGFDLEPLPLKDYNNIHEGNALRMDWNDVVPASELSYIMGNPPFIGFYLQTDEQKKEIVDITGEGSLDYVSGWYYKAAEYADKHSIRIAYVSTNSITQGEQVAMLWQPLFEKYHLNIDFAYRTFVWNSEANEKAAVHCVIIGFSRFNLTTKKLFDSNGVHVVKNISPYLIEGSNITVRSRTSPLCNIPPLTLGNRPLDGQNLLLTKNERDIIIDKDPGAATWIRPFLGASEFINRQCRYCLWLVEISPTELRRHPQLIERVEACRKARLNAKDKQMRRLADTPTLFRESKVSNSPYIVLPRVSSSRREYMPIGYLDPSIISGDALQMLLGASLYHFGVLMSCVHNSWLRVVGGRLKSDYRYGKETVYNTFPWPSPSENQRIHIEKTAQGILDTRDFYPEASLADLYDELTMPPELRKAHRANDLAVLEAYGFPKDATESEIVARLFRMYQELTS